MLGCDPPEDAAALDDPVDVASWESTSPDEAAPADPQEPLSSHGRSAEAHQGPYPIVFAHGFFGFETFAGLDFLTYFYGVRDELALYDELEVFTPAVDPFNSSEVRALQLLAQVETVIAITGRKKVNIIAHSQGGLDARIVATLRPDLVASVTTIATPHQGTIVADIVHGLIPNVLVDDLIDAMTQILMGPVYGSFDNESSMMAALKQLTRSSMKAFNAKYPPVPGVEYFSFGGRSGWMLGRQDCRPDEYVPFVDSWAYIRDPLDVALTVPGTILAGFWWDLKAHDGLVRAEDSRYGTFLGCVPADHFDQIGQIFGDSAGWLNWWSYLDFYADLVVYLRERGL